jgi:uncharacterized membrane protein (Fun14 family)
MSESSSNQTGSDQAQTQDDQQQPAPAGGEPSGSAGPVAFVASQPTWVKVVAGLSLTLLLIGGGLEALAWLGAPPSEGSTAPSAPAEETRPVEGSGQTSDRLPKSLARGLTAPDRSTPQQPSEGPREREPGETTGQASPGDTVGDQIERWGPSVLGLGMTFFIGFAVGYAIRALFKIALAFIGFFFLGVLMLQQIGVVEVHWDRVEEFNWVLDWALQKLMSLKDLLTEVLPAGSMSALGLAAGLRKR